MKTLAQQVEVMSFRWPEFELVTRSRDRVIWAGSLVGIERPYKITVEYGTPVIGVATDLFRRFPLVRVSSPRLTPRPHAIEEAPLPHVFLDEFDITQSALCLFDPDANEWGPDDLIAFTTIPWSADWLACYEGWLATGRWHGGGRHGRSGYRGAIV
jgi:hypothetical protein